MTLLEMSIVPPESHPSSACNSNVSSMRGLMKSSLLSGSMEIMIEIAACGVLPDGEPNSVASNDGSDR
jgi:hypothetical protein